MITERTITIKIFAGSELRHSETFKSAKVYPKFSSMYCFCCESGHATIHESHPDADNTTFATDDSLIDHLDGMAHDIAMQVVPEYDYDRVTYTITVE